MAAIEELEALLQSLQVGKPPGVTGTKIKEITQKSVDNVQVCERTELRTICDIPGCITERLAVQESRATPSVDP
jgi:hypothetical protein